MQVADSRVFYVDSRVFYMTLDIFLEKVWQVSHQGPKSNLPIRATLQQSHKPCHTAKNYM